MITHFLICVIVIHLQSSKHILDKNSLNIALHVVVVHRSAWHFDPPVVYVVYDGNYYSYYNDLQVIRLL